MDIFSIRLKEERLHGGFTQKSFAELLNIPLKTYRNYETTSKAHREPDFEMLVKIAKLLDANIEYLLGKEN